MALAGVAFLGLFSIHLVVELIRTGDIPDNFILFLIGFLLILVGQLLFARALRSSLGWAWVLPIVAVAGLVMALFLNSIGLHDIGLFVFEGAWIGLGIAILRAEPQPAPEAEPALALVERTAASQRWPEAAAPASCGEPHLKTGGRGSNSSIGG